MLQVTEALEKGTAKQFLVMVYQPIVRLDEERFGEIVGLEALARWNHPNENLLPPSSFIPAIEKSGLMTTFCEAVFQATLEEFFESSLAQENDSLWISVNASPDSLITKHFQEKVSLLLWEKEPGRVVIELAEKDHFPVKDESDQFKKFEAFMKRLKDSGVQLAIDDFGAGYSLESLVRAISVDILKIDRSIISQVGKSARFYQIAKYIIELAHHLEMKVVGEGIESLAEAHFLQALKCDYGQGYYFGKPTSLESIGKDFIEKMSLIQ
jgi:diguanylate cyclase